MKRTIALLLCLFTLFTTVQVSAFALPATTLTQAVTKPDQVKNVKAAAGANYVTLTWSKASGAQKYYVFSYNASTKKYTCLGKTTATTYKVSGLKVNTIYRLAVQAAKTVSGKTYYGKVSETVSVKTKVASTVAKVSGLKITTSGKSGYLKLSWNAQKSITGFQVYRSTSGKSGTYKRIATLKSSQVSYADSGLKNSTPYYYAVRAYKKASNGYTYGSFAKIDLSTRITKSYIKKKIERANYLWLGWVSHTMEFSEDNFDKKDIIYRKIDGYTYRYYRLKNIKYKSLSQLKKDLSTCFDKRLYEEHLNENYIEKNGKIYGIEWLTEHGGDGSPCRLSLINIRYTDSTCTYTIKGFVDRIEEMYDFSTYRLYYKNGNWIYIDHLKYDIPYENFAMYDGLSEWID